MILENKFWLGIDENLEISIFEYGLLYNSHTNRLIYGSEMGEHGNYVKFHSTHFTEKECNDIINESWFPKKSFFSTIGSTESDWLQLGIENKLYDLISNNNIEDVLGSNYGRKEYDVDEINELLFDMPAKHEIENTQFDC